MREKKDNKEKEGDRERKREKRENKKRMVTLSINLRNLSRYRRKQVSLETRKSRRTLLSPPRILISLMNPAAGHESN